MNNFLAARSQMGMSLGFNIIFAVIGMALPMMMSIAEWRWRTTADPAYLLLAKRWAKGTAILFAVGAVSGTVLSFRARAALAAVHAVRGLRHWYAVFSRRFRIFH